MPTPLPYSPSLVLGSIVDPAVMDNLLAISAAQTPIDAAQETLNSFISMKRSLEMTVQELINMGLDPKDLLKKVQEVGVDVDKAATAYATVRLEQELSRCASAPRWRHKACSSTRKAMQARHSHILSRRGDWPATPSWAASCCWATPGSP